MKKIAGFIFFILLSGCVRITGNAGYWHQGPNDEAPKSKQAGFDTNDLVPGAPAPGSITKEEQ